MKKTFNEQSSTSNCNGKNVVAANNFSDERRCRELTRWLETLPLSKPVQSTGRDFSDAVLVAEIVAHFLPRYVPTQQAFAHVHSLALKKYNWESLHKVVLRHLGIRLSAETIENLVRGDEEVVEAFLSLLRSKINEALEQRRFRPSSRSRLGSRGGSQQYLDQIDQPRMSHERIELAERQIPVLDTMDKDQLIERLYAKIRAQETELIRKEEQIEALTRRVDKLVELLCEKKPQHGNRDARDQVLLNGGGDFD